MKREDFIKGFNEIDSWFSKSIFKACVNCLTPEQVCELFDPGCNHSSKRAITSERLIEDIRRELLPCHCTLIGRLLQQFPLYDYRQRQRIGMYLEAVYDASRNREPLSANVEVQKQILSTFLESRDKGVRNRAYKKLRERWIPGFEETIINLFNKYGDDECLMLMVAYFPDEFIIENFDLLNKLVNWWKVRITLYKRMGRLSDSKNTLMLETDPLTYTYTRTLLGKPLGDDEAFTIYERYRSDRRSRILIWCFGKMGLLNVLMRIYEEGKPEIMYSEYDEAPTFDRGDEQENE